MHILGIDFTSAPCAKKPITLALGELTPSGLCLHAVQPLVNFSQFEAVLAQQGPWVAALDFPFSLPEKYLQDIGLPLAWETYVPVLCGEPLEAFLQRIRDYRANQPKGQKYHFRATDQWVKSCSPMMIDYTPVGRMFYQGAYRLLKSGVSVLPFQPPHTDRVALEGYPALLARRALQAIQHTGKSNYKSDARSQQTSAQAHIRALIVQSIITQQLQAELGFTIDLHALQAQLIQDPTGDSLDAALCAIQAAWAYTRREENYGIPLGGQAREGWIIHPFFDAPSLNSPSLDSSALNLSF